MSKKAQQQVSSFVKLFIPAGQASPTPPIGPALGQRGVKAIDFCKQYNEHTKDIITGVPMRVMINVKPDRTFAFTVKPPATSYFIKKAASIEKGSGEPGKTVAGTISLKHVYEIAKMKKMDPLLSDLPLKTLCSQVIGSCRSMGINVVA